MSERIDYIKVDAISPNPNNPRKHFDQPELEILAQSIREVGVLQPVLAVNSSEPDETYRLVAGERRWRAAQLAGLLTIPAIVKKLTPEQEAEIMLIENLQRKDLDPIEEARAYQVLLKEHEYTQETLGNKLGVSQAHIANRMRLLELPDSVQQNISREIISPSHGLVLAGYRNLPAPVLKKAVEVIAEKQIPVARADKTVLKVIADTGKSLERSHYTGDGRAEFEVSECEGCKSRIMGNRYGYGDNEPFCVKPSCWDKRQRYAKQERERELADKAQKSAKNGGGVVDLASFSYGQYEELLDYKTKDLDLSECQGCEHKKVAQGYSDSLTEACFMPSCFKKKQAAATQKKNKAAKTAFQAELEEITELAQIAAGACLAIPMPRPVLIYLAAQVLANITNAYERKVTRYQYVKDRFGWDDGCFKTTAYHSLGSEWDTFRTRLETLTDGQLWEIIFEWPAVAGGLTGARSWIFEQGLAADEDLEPDEPLDSEGHNVCRVCGRPDRMPFPVGCYWVEPDLCNECVGKRRAEETRGAKYRYNDFEIFVSKGLGSEYGTFRRSDAGGLHRIKSPAMPMVATAQEAQVNLDAWAEAKGLRAVKKAEAS